MSHLKKNFIPFSKKKILTHSGPDNMEPLSTRTFQFNISGDSISVYQIINLILVWDLPSFGLDMNSFGYFWVEPRVSGGHPSYT